MKEKINFFKKLDVDERINIRAVTGIKTPQEIWGNYIPNEEPEYHNNDYTQPSNFYCRISDNKMNAHSITFIHPTTFLRFLVNKVKYNITFERGI